ncbi:MAG: hypothetical protein J6K21_05585 [Bacilli bacterium]|nr:hypothetical protein [Bacilli bacterium]
MKINFKYDIKKIDNNIIYFMSGSFKNGNYEYAILEYQKNNFKKYSDLNEMDSITKKYLKMISNLVT